MTTRLLLLGAGRSASSLIQYLLRHAPTENWFLTVADANPAHLAPVLAAHSEYARAVPFALEDEALLDELVEQADVVISMLPAMLHAVVARACVRHGRHLATASYVSPEIRALHEEAVAAGVTLLMECGLDPGLDHMSAMRAIEHIRARGGRLTSFKSYCGGLLAPAAEGDNPWKYKFTWNPRNVVLAGQSTAKYLENGLLRFIPYQQLFARTETLAVPGYGEFEGYANRDSLSYRTPYGLDDIPTILRGTLRRPGYCAAWHALVRLGLTDDTVNLDNSEAMTWAELVEAYLPVSLVPDLDLSVRVANYLGLDPTGEEMGRLNWLGLFSDRPVGHANGTPAQLLERLLSEKWQLQPHDHDLIVMQHLFGFELNGAVRSLTSSLAVLGDDATHTAMAKTVGLPLGMAVRRLVRGEITQRGVLLPVGAELYEPILDELAADYGIVFTEEEN
ncbi:saccharopine dehydrogenase C-terminal domain-containing protein [Hymenobacter sp. BT770]|uniref:saccharopine dehydrogenase C-terminal domain-containing protein n=1 Tax=Hymenobacter sp. BT770 TaxID=2886942 RepID=UPI001D0FA4C6|nr:saccharopine dehydrogenase C-terminal domain-containing protein [Hymenobacter sp. BT770]MCC3152406.1 saccharopine dehydrogenase NADP-binding domain-containing protein [Hymenobacter sp. BT770]MDO3414618.1 saccharopine dehydrogenase C-terminal domain-containing protein [Hymenobacter sp. BT770]